MTSESIIWGKQTVSLKDARYYNIHNYEVNTNMWYFEFDFGENQTDCLYINAKSCKLGFTPKTLYKHPRSLQYKSELLENTAYYQNKHFFLSELYIKMLSLDDNNQLLIIVKGKLDKGWFRKINFEIITTCRFTGILLFGENESEKENMLKYADNFIITHDKNLSRDFEKCPSGYKVTIK